MKQFISNNPKLINILKLMLLFGTLGFIVFKLFVAYNLETLLAEFRFEADAATVSLLAAATVLMLLNWGTEVLKWKMLVDKFENISYGNAFKAVLSGVTLSIITPNQIGDFAGRVLHLEKLNRIRGSLVTVVGHTAQLLVTAFLGMFAILAHLTTIDIEIFFRWKMIAVAFVIVQAIVLFGYLRLDLLYRFLGRLCLFLSESSLMFRRRLIK